MEKVVIVVPRYKNELSNNEKISLKLLFDNLSEFPIVFVSPLQLKDYYTDENVEYFDDDFFISIDSYNKLMLSCLFYERFSMYEYMLIYQLDALVFSNKLLYFCNLDYDYIGAPWLEDYSMYKDRSRKFHVGNGGLSLRKIKACIQIIESEKELLVDYNSNEDIFFSYCNGDNFRVAPMDIAMNFSIEKNVREFYSFNSKKLPFGCHAWQKYDSKFWIKILNQNGIHVNEEECLNLDWENISIGEKLNLCLRYPYSIKKVIEELLHSEDSNIAIYGAGMRGQNICKLLVQNELNISCFYDNDKSGEIDGIPIKKIDKNDVDKKTVIFAVKNLGLELDEIVIKNGIKMYIEFEELIERIFKMLKEIYMDII